MSVSGEFSDLCRPVAARFLGTGEEIIECSRASGGFSEDLVIHLRTASGEYALRSWRTLDWPRSRVLERHRWLRHLRDAGIPVAVPLRVQSELNSIHESGESCWQMEPWLPGRPLAEGELTGDHLRSMMTMVARMHQASSQYRSTPAGEDWFGIEFAPSPSISERLHLIAAWIPSRISEARELLSRGQEAFPAAAGRVLENFVRLAPRITTELRSLREIPVFLFPCFRDLWRAHVLFAGNEVTGIIDPTAARKEHPAADLSRLLGSVLGDDAARWKTALDEYESIRPLSSLDHRLIRAFDRSSALLSGMTWIDRWMGNRIPESQLPEVTSRMHRLVERLQRM